MRKQQSKWTFLALQYLGLGAKKLGRLLSARATALEKKAPSQRASPPFCSARGEALTRERVPSQRACGHQETTIKMGKQQSKWTFLVLQYLGLGAKKLGRLLSALMITRRHQGKAKGRARTRTQQSPMVFFFVTFCFIFSGMASNPNNNTEDALVELSPIGAQAAPDADDLVESSPIGAQGDPDDDDVQIVGAPRAIEERNTKKHKSNDGRKRPAISKKQQKRPAISDTNLEKQLDRGRDVSL